MELSALAQVGTMVLAAMAIVWHQQRSNDKLRDDVRNEIGGIRNETGGIRNELAVVHSVATENGQRLARIEGYLGIGMPAEAAAGAAGAEVVRTTQSPNG
ncbi:hypothetical protein [Candidatus Poriferisodalis sp.]|uniref:hypothetical protein n=1 Tax=Candidatus Poriferisodalis sp. TaxID=3101277 RepID=UPI003D0DDAFA